MKQNIILIIQLIIPIILAGILFYYYHDFLFKNETLKFVTGILSALISCFVCGYILISSYVQIIKKYWK